MTLPAGSRGELGRLARGAAVDDPRPVELADLYGPESHAERTKAQMVRWGYHPGYIGSLFRSGRGGDAHRGWRPSSVAHYLANVGLRDAVLVR